MQCKLVCTILLCQSFASEHAKHALTTEPACFNLPVGEHVPGEDGGAGQGEGYQDRPEQSGANRCVRQVLNSLREENIFDTRDQW